MLDRFLLLPLPVSSHNMICTKIISPLSSVFAPLCTQPVHRQLPCPTQLDWYSAQPNFHDPAAWRDDAGRLDSQPVANSFYSHEESAASRFFVPVSQDLGQVTAYDRCRHYDSLPYAHSTASFSASYSAPGGLYYAEYYPTRRPDQLHSYEMPDATAGLEKFSFEDLEILHAGDILALESPLPPGHNTSTAPNKWPDVSHSMADISSESICTHSDSSCDEYIVTSLDDSSTSSGATGTFCNAENWASSHIPFNEGMVRTSEAGHMHMQSQPLCPEAGVKLETGE